VEEALQVALQREPQHGALHLSGGPLKPDQAFTVRDLKGLKVRSDIPHQLFHVGVERKYIPLTLCKQTVYYLHIENAYGYILIAVYLYACVLFA